jgi:hypothetical protein
MRACHHYKDMGNQLIISYLETFSLRITEHLFPTLAVKIRWLFVICDADKVRLGTLGEIFVRYLTISLLHKQSPR